MKDIKWTFIKAAAMNGFTYKEAEKMLNFVWKISDPGDDGVYDSFLHDFRTAEPFWKDELYNCDRLVRKSIVYYKDVKIWGAGIRIDVEPIEHALDRKRADYRAKFFYGRK